MSLVVYVNTEWGREGNLENTVSADLSTTLSYPQKIKHFHLINIIIRWCIFPLSSSPIKMVWDITPNMSDPVCTLSWASECLTRSIYSVTLHFSMWGTFILKEKTLEAAVCQDLRSKFCRNPNQSQDSGIYVTHKVLECCNDAPQIANASPFSYPWVVYSHIDSDTGCATCYVQQDEWEQIWHKKSFELAFYTAMKILLDYNVK